MHSFEVEEDGHYRHKNYDGNEERIYRECNKLQHYAVTVKVLLSASKPVISTLATDASKACNADAGTLMTVAFGSAFATGAGFAIGAGF